MYSKIKAVIEGCRTHAQLATAMRMLQLAQPHVTPTELADLSYRAGYTHARLEARARHATVPELP